MLDALARNPARRRVATVTELKAPVGGWNARDDITDMPATDALVLENMVVKDGGVEVRKGKKSHATGIAAAVRTLMTWSGPDEDQVLFAATDAAIYDVSPSGAVGAASVSGLGGGAWSHVMFATTGGNFLVCANGEDSVRNFDGTTWTTPTITGVTSSNLVSVASHMARVWFIEKDSLKVWYLDALAIAGTATAINFGGFCKKGGKLVAMASWTRDGGAGMDDVAVFITSEGEAIVYQGIDPSSAETWALVGIFSIPRPMGVNCIVKFGADVGILTVQGLLALSSILPITSSGQANKAMTDKITKAFTDAARRAEFYPGWQVIESQSDKLIVVNVPHVQNQRQYQYVLSTTTGGWSKWAGLNMGCWGVLNGQLYCGDNLGTIWSYSGTTDDGTAITWTVVQAFSNLGNARTKSFKRIRPQLFTVAGYRPAVGLRIDYDDTQKTFTAPAATGGGTEWGSDWGSPWSASRKNTGWWQSCIGEGYVVAPVVIGSTVVATGYNGCKLAYEVGQAL